MTSLASVILSGAKNLNSCRAMARKSQTDPLPPVECSEDFGGPCRTRTYDPLIKSQLLYQLS